MATVTLKRHNNGPCFVSDTGAIEITAGFGAVTMVTEKGVYALDPVGKNMFEGRCHGHKVSLAISENRATLTY